MLDLPQSTPHRESLIRQKLLSFFLAFVGFLIVHQCHDVRNYYFDSKAYWELGDLSRLLVEKDNIRGYVFSALLAPIRLVSEWLGQYWFYAFRVSASIVYAIVLTGTIPDLIAKLVGGRTTVARRVVTPLLVALLYPGLILYPLSDLPAFLMVLCGVSLALRNPSRITDFLWAGILLSAGYNIRTIYFVVLLLVFACIPFLVLGSRRNRVVALSMFLVGASAVALPQIMVNERIHNVLSPFVIAKTAGRSLIASQLQWGITIQRYETSIDPRVPAPSQVYLDKAGEKLFVEEGVIAPMTLASYVYLVLKRPLDFLGIYGRHFVNGLDLRDGAVYLSSPTSEKEHLAFISFVLFYAGMLSMRNLQHTPRSVLLFTAMMCPVLLILPGAVETRFFLPLHFFAWSILVVRFDLGALRSVSLKYWSFQLMSFFFFLMLFMSISQSTMASLMYGFPVRYL